MQVGLVVGLDPGQPVFKCEQALPAGHHVGEVPDVPGQGVQVRAAGPDRGEPGLVAVVEAGGAGQQPAGDLAGFRHGRGGGDGRAGLPEQVDVPADGLRAAGPAALGELGVDLGSLGEALIPPLADVGLELIQLRVPAHAGHQLLGAGGPGVLLHGPAVQAGGPADRGLRLSGVQPLADLGVAFPGAPGHLPFPAAHVQGPVLRDRRGLRLLRPRRIRRTWLVLIAGLAGGLVLQAAAMPGHRFLGVFCQVVPQVEPV